jgi:hypothetical protein
MLLLHFLRERSSGLFNFPKEWRSDVHHFILVLLTYSVCNQLHGAEPIMRRCLSLGDQEIYAFYWSLKFIHYCVYNNESNSVCNFIPYFFMMLISFHSAISSGFFRLGFLNFMLYKILMSGVRATCSIDLDFASLSVHGCYNFTVHYPHQYYWLMKLFPVNYFS